MQLFVCGRYLDKYLIANRFNSIGAVINEKMYYELLRLSKINLEVVPWIVELLAKLKFKATCQQKLNDIILVKKATNFSFVKVSYEITEVCNYKCGHCYLDHKKTSSLSLLDKKKIISLIEKSGCLWLQITGGEPLLDKDFAEVYQFAHSLGLLITLSTNGSLLSEDRTARIIKALPPYRLTMSFYGATRKSYELLTGVSGSFQQFMNSINWIKKTGIKTRLNIIATKYNQNEIKSMVNLAKNFGFEHYIFSTLSPTIHGNPDPIKLMSKNCKNTEKLSQNIPEKDHYTPCKAGKVSFHINSRGEASICKAVREPNIDLIQNDTSSFYILSQISEKLMDSSSPCSHCELRENCPTCPLILKLYLDSVTVPLSVCKKYCSNDLKKN